MPFALSPGLVGDYGALPASRVNRASETAIAVPFQFTIEPAALSEVSIGVFAHIFYPDLSGEIGAALQNITSTFDLFVSTDTPEKASTIAAALRGTNARRLTIRVFPNRGRDIAPFLVGFADEIPRYDLLLHLHSKKSKHDDILNGWREYTFRQLLGSPAIINSIIYMLSQGHASIAFADHFKPVVQSLNFGFDYPHMRNIMEQLGARFTKDILLDFPSGSMFWATAPSLKPLLDLGLRFDDFPLEEGQIDGTLAHGIERSFLYVIESSGGRWAKIVRPEDSDRPNHVVPVCNPRDIPLTITRASRRLLGNRISINLQPRSFPEIPSVGFRGEPSTRLRFNLLTPTLKPEKIFGGVASALRLFKEILDSLPSDTEARIISITDGVDRSCLDELDGYVIVSLGAESTAAPRTLVDASGVRAEQLPIRKKDVFLATAWWTAHFGFEIREMQQALYGSAPVMLYFIQDHEPDFYGWSPRYALAQATYMRKAETRAIINSEELYNFFAKNYDFDEPCYVPYAANRRLRGAFRARPKERIILVYARPSTPRNAFELLFDGLCLWQQVDPISARAWRVVAAGEEFEPWRAQHVANVEIVGKLSLSDYADILCRAAVGVSLMISPHPSYPPLEMAEAGMFVISNDYSGKDLTRRSDNIATLKMLTPASLSEAITTVIAKAESKIGSVLAFESIRQIPCGGQIFSASSMAKSTVLPHMIE